MSNLTLKATPNSYEAAVKALGSRESVTIGHNTKLERNGGNEIVATYHGNAIVSYTPDGVWATWAGWTTNTTATRLNMLAPARFNIKNFTAQINGEDIDSREWVKVS
jgi:hypothetical protein